MHISRGVLLQQILPEKDTYQEEAPRTRRSFNRGSLLLIGIVALALNLYRLGAPSIWFDEMLSVERARQPLDILWKIIFSTQPNMALYYLMLHFWLSGAQLLGFLPTEVVVRLPSALLAAAGSIFFFLLGKRFLGTRAAWFSTALYVTNALQLTYAQETRSYSMQLLLVTITWYIFFAAITTQNRRWWIGYAIAATLAIYTHLFSEFIIFTQALVFATLLIIPNSWRTLVRKQLLAYTVSLICIGVLLLPLLIASLTKSKNDWLPSPTVSDAVHIFAAVGGGNKIYLALLVICCLVALGRLLQIATARTNGASSLKLAADDRLKNNLSPLIFSLVCWCVVPFIISFVVSQGSIRVFSARYLVVIITPLLLLAGLGLSLLPWKIFQTVVFVIFFITACTVVPFYYQSAQVEDWRQVATWFQQHYHAQDGVLCYDNAEGCELGLEYYLRAYPNGVSYPTDAPGSYPWVDFDLNQTGTVADVLDPKVIAPYGAQHKRILFVIARVTGDDNLARVQVARNWLDSHYHFKEQIVTRLISIRVYDTTAQP